MPLSVQWLKGLHPDLFFIAEHNNDTTVASFLPRITNSFDFTAYIIEGHDRLCTAAEQQADTLRAPPSAETDSRSHVRGHGGAAVTAMDEGGEERGDEDPLATEDAPELMGFRIGLPRSSLRSRLPEADGCSPAAVLQCRLDRKSMVVLERFMHLRTLYLALAMDGEQRFFGLKTYRQWVEMLTRHGFAPSPVAGDVGNDVAQSSQVYPKGFGARPIGGGVELVMWGRDRLQTTLWCG